MEILPFSVRQELFGQDSIYVNKKEQRDKLEKIIKRYDKDAK